MQVRLKAIRVASRQRRRRTCLAASIREYRDQWNARAKVIRKLVSINLRHQNGSISWPLHSQQTGPQVIENLNWHPFLLPRWVGILSHWQLWRQAMWWSFAPLWWWFDRSTAPRRRPRTGSFGKKMVNKEEAHPPNIAQYYIWGFP